MSLPAKIETAANLTSIAVGVLVCAVLVKTYIIPEKAAGDTVNKPPAERIAEGMDVKASLPGVDWNKNGRTLVLAISTTCHFCKDSEPLYRRIRQETGGRLKMVAVLPQATPDARSYLGSVGVQVDDVRQLRLDTIGVRGTPTISR